MFNGKKDSSKGKIETLISHGATFTGTIKSEGTIRIDGKIDGEVDSDGDIIIGELGKIKGLVKGNNLTVAGQIEGDVDIYGTLHLLQNGIILGDIIVKNLDIESGAMFKGSCTMKDDIKMIEDITGNENNKKKKKDIFNADVKKI